MPPLDTPEADFDVDSFASDIAAELGGGDEAGGAGSDETGSTREATSNQTTAPPAPSPAPAPTDTSNLAPPAAPVAPPPSARALPKAWRKEMEAHWSTLPPALQDYVYEREADVSRGIQMYRDGHENWSQLLAPYRSMLDQVPDLNPREFLNNLMQSHLRLLSGTPEQRAAYAQHLLKEYQIDLGATPAPGTEQFAALQSRLDLLEQGNKQAQLNSALAHVNAFFSDAKNEFAPELAGDILDLIKRGYDLPSAYEHAKWTNPTVRAKLLARQQQPAPGAAALNAGARDVRRPPPPAPRKSASLDDSIDAIAAEVTGRKPH